MYWRKTYRTPMGRVVKEYHNGRAAPPPGSHRSERKKPTSEEKARLNRKAKEERIQLLLMNNFREGDYYITLTYRKERRPEGMKEAKKDLTAAIRALRREYKKAGEPLRWMANIEKGSRGGWHIHLALNRIMDTDLMVRRVWEHDRGGAHMDLMYEEGGFRQLAGYFAKDQDDGAAENSYSHSRNLVMPKEEKKEIKRPKTWKDEIRPPAGFRLDKSSVEEGYTRSGHPYRRYVLLPDERRESDAGGARIRRNLHENAGKVSKKGNVYPGAYKRGSPSGHTAGNRGRRRNLQRNDPEGD